MNNFKLIIFLLLLFSSCSKDRYHREIRGLIPENMVDEADCSADTCSIDRIQRLSARGVRGLYNFDFARINVAVSFDTEISFIVCNGDEFNDFDGDCVFSGEVRDACGIHEARHPFEEVYFIHLTRLRRSLF